MEAVPALNIQLDHPGIVYFPGQNISGKFIVQTNMEMKLKEIRVTFKGMGKDRWIETGRHGDKLFTSVFTASENYLDQSIPFFGKGMGMGEQSYLPPATYIHSFSFTLPQNLPSSFVGKYGYVRYYVTGTIEMSKKKKYENEQPFNVTAQLDLNAFSNAACRTEKQQEKYICCFCCMSGKIIGKLTLDRIGYVPGDTILFHTEIQNFSWKACKSYVKFYQRVTFRSKKSFITSEEIIATVTHRRIEPGSSETWIGESFIVPCTPSSNPAGCSMIDIDYYVELIVDPVNWPGKALHVPIKIIIGTIPIRRDNQTVQPVATLSALELEIPRGPKEPPVLATARKSETTK